MAKMVTWQKMKILHLGHFAGVVDFPLIEAQHWWHTSSVEAQRGVQDIGFSAMTTSPARRGLGECGQIYVGEKIRFLFRVMIFFQVWGFEAQGLVLYVQSSGVEKAEFYF